MVATAVQMPTQARRRPDLTRFARETVGSSYYRRRPLEIVRYGRSKLDLSRGRRSPRDVLARLAFEPVDALAGLERWQPLLDEMYERVAAAPGHQGALSANSALVEYGIVRSIRPEIVIETGVASGVSSAHISAALLENGHGSLISIDLPPEGPVVLADGAPFDWSGPGIGWAIPSEIREQMGDRHRIELEDVRTSLPRILDEVGTIDCFVHDDLHTPDHMRWELDLVWSALRPGGVVMADDANHAWTRFVQDVGPGHDAFLNTDRLAAVRKPSGR